MLKWLYSPTGEVQQCRPGQNLQWTSLLGSHLWGAQATFGGSSVLTIQEVFILSHRSMYFYFEGIHFYQSHCILTGAKWRWLQGTSNLCRVSLRRFILFLASYILSKLEIFTCSCIYCNPWQIQTSPNVNINPSNFQSLGQLESSSQRVRWILQVLIFSTPSMFLS